jgi:5-methylcytosine-specific restriction protein A
MAGALFGAERMSPFAPKRHNPSGQSPKERRQRYDQQRNQQEHRKFYGTKRWRDFRAWYRQEHPLCEDCLERGITKAMDEVHHVAKLKDNPDKAVDEQWVRSLCTECHSTRTAKGE